MRLHKVDTREKAEAFDILRRVVDTGAVVPVCLKKGQEFYLAITRSDSAMRITREEWEMLVRALY